MTPDLPQMMFWSATLYYCYRAIIMDEKNCFYIASIALGLGLLSKYTIVLLVPATLVLISIAPEYRKWWRCKELYIGAIIVVLLFSPVIYWNYKHNWISFAFQTTVRIQDTHRFSTHLVLLYTVFFIMPGGLWGLKKIVTIKQANNDQNFIKVYTILPLLVFTLFSLHNQIKFNWLGPVFLALVPWIAYLLQTSQYPRHCYRVLMGLIPAYMVALLIMVSSQPPELYKLFFNKFFSWYNLSIDVNKIAQEIEKKNNKPPFLLAMDKYNINSEISFYQQKAVHNKTIIKSYPVLGQHVFNNPSLMFKFWDKAPDHHGDNLIIMSWNKSDLHADYLTDFVKFTSDIKAFLTYSPRGNYHLSRLYYRTAEML
jgi:dolichol-phosphate mannosyltransferase